jgi:signal transduction histidine kinase
MNYIYMEKKYTKKLNKLREYLSKSLSREIDLNVSVYDALGITNSFEKLDSVEMAHEIKTPLITALYNLDKITDNSKEVAEIKLSLLHIKDIVENSNVLRENNDISKICKEASIISGGKNRIIIKDKLSRRFIINSDRVTKIRQIFIILFSNALKYSLEKSKVNVLIYDKDNKVHCEITSKGYTIEKREWGRIFIKGKRLSNAIDKPGNGLGLSIAYRISMKIKADLRVIKSDNDETVFLFVLSK